jgi:hypothetical protein
MGVAPDIAMAQASLQGDVDAVKVFQFVIQRSSANGWMIVKELGQDATQTAASLDKLRNLGLLEGSGEGLDGFYHSTSLGYAVRESL